MNQQKTLSIVVVLFAAAVIGFFVYFFMDQKKQQLKTALVAQQQQEQAEKEQKEKEEKAKKDKEIEDIMKGLDKTIGGKIESINQGEKSFVIDLDPLGNHQRYTIQTSNETEFEMIYVDTKIIDPNAEALGAAEEVTEQKFEIGLDQLKVGDDAQVEFAKRISIDDEKKLTAIKVNTIYHKIIK